MTSRNTEKTGAGGQKDDPGPLSGPSERVEGPSPAPLDQPMTPQQQAEMVAKDPPIEYDPIGQALLSAAAEGVLQAGTALVKGAEYVAEKAGEEMAAFVASEGVSFGVDKAVDASQGSADAPGSKDQGGVEEPGQKPTSPAADAPPEARRRKRPHKHGGIGQDR